MSDIQVSDANFDEQVIKSQLPVMVDFWAPWCGPCRMLVPVVEELAKEYEGKVKILKLNTDDNPVTTSTYKISAIPSLIFFKGGKAVSQLVGMQPKEELKKQLDALL